MTPTIAPNDLAARLEALHYDAFTAGNRVLVDLPLAVDTEQGAKRLMARLARDGFTAWHDGISSHVAIRAGAVTVHESTAPPARPGTSAAPLAPAPTARPTLPGAAAKVPPLVLNKLGAWKAIQQAANAQRRPGETDEQAVARFVEMPTGARMYDGYQRAPAATAAQVAPSPVGGPGPAERAAYARIRTKAAELRASQPRLTEAQAIAQVAETQPDLYEDYLSAKETDQAMAEARA